MSVCPNLGAHKQSWVKVNTQVDSKLREMVSLLSRIPRLQTISSCQGQTGKAQGYVYFCFGNWRVISKFVFEEIAPALRGIEATVSVEIFNGSEPLGKIGFRAEELNRVTSALKLLLMRRRFGCSRGNVRRAPRS